MLAGTPRPRTAARRRAVGPEEGAAVVEFVMISVLLVILLFGVLQVAAVFYVRNVVAASVADAARYAADANVDVAQGGPRATTLIGQRSSQSVARGLTCTGDQVPGRSGLVYSRVRCTGRIRAFWVPFGSFVPVHVTARAVKEQ